MNTSKNLNDPNEDWWDELTTDQQNHIKEGIADAEAGLVISSEEFWKRFTEPDTTPSSPINT
jgi:predicted transcriptional regulator